jgi:uncharacterized protein YqhQ
MQKLTTREPDDSMIEVAIAALKRVLVEDGYLTAQEGLAAGSLPDGVSPLGEQS